MHHRQFHRELSQQGHAALVSKALATTGAKELVALLGCIRRDEGRHVLHDTQHGHTELLEHRQAAPRVLKGDHLGRRHDDHASHGDRLGQAELGIAGARRQVNHEHIPLAPLHLVEELANDAVEHRAAPDHGLMGIDQQAHRDHGDAAALDRGQDLVIAAAPHLGGLVGHPQHRRGIGAIDIRIEQADLEAAFGQGAGQVHRHGALAHAPFAAAHGDDLFDAGDGLALGATTAMACGPNRCAGMG